MREGFCIALVAVRNPCNFSELRIRQVVILAPILDAVAYPSSGEIISASFNAYFEETFRLPCFAVQTRFANDERVYKAFLEILNMYRKGLKTIGNVYEEVRKLIHMPVSCRLYLPVLCLP